MNAYDMARTAYSSSTSPVRTDRGTEYEVFARVTHRLKAAMRDDAPFSEMAAALHQNRRLWTTLSAAVADDGNRLPRAMRAQIFFLAEFTEQHTRKVLRRDANCDALIEINSAIMRGLRAGRGAE